MCFSLNWERSNWETSMFRRSLRGWIQPRQARLSTLLLRYGEMNHTTRNQTFGPSGFSSMRSQLWTCPSKLVRWEIYLSKSAKASLSKFQRFSPKNWPLWFIICSQSTRNTDLQFKIYFLYLASRPKWKRLKGFERRPSSFSRKNGRLQGFGRGKRLRWSAPFGFLRTWSLLRKCSQSPNTIQKKRKRL